MKQKPLKPGRITLDGATLELSMFSYVAPHLRDGIREITSLHVSPELRGRGLAKALMTDVCRQATQHGISLILKPEAFGVAPGLDDQSLAQWYAQEFGFFTLQRKPCVLMLRMPREEQPTGLLQATAGAAAVGQAHAR